VHLRADVALRAFNILTTGCVHVFSKNPEVSQQLREEPPVPSKRMIIQPTTFDNPTYDEQLSV